MSMRVGLETASVQNVVRVERPRKEFVRKVWCRVGCQAWCGGWSVVATGQGCCCKTSTIWRSPATAKGRKEASVWPSNWVTGDHCWWEGQGAYCNTVPGATRAPPWSSWWKQQCRHPRQYHGLLCSIETAMVNVRTLPFWSWSWWWWWVSVATNPGRGECTVRGSVRVRYLLLLLLPPLLLP